MSHLAWDESQRLDSIKPSYAKLIETKPLKNEWWVEIKSNLLATKIFVTVEECSTGLKDKRDRSQRLIKSSSMKVDIIDQSHFL